MIKKFLFLSTLFFMMPIVANHHVPEKPKDELIGSFHLRYFHKKEDISIFSEVNALTERDNRSSKSFTLGIKHRPFSNLKTGFYYSRQYGLRHDEDWIKENNEWVWRDTNSRGENFLIIDIAPRFILDFLPGENWVAELRLRSLYNFFNSDITEKIRPGLTYHWFKKGTPFMSLYTHYEWYLPLNYGKENVYERWAYLGFMYYINTNFQIGSYLAHRKVTWRESNAAKNSPNNTYYKFNERTNILGLTLNIKTFD